MSSVIELTVMPAKYGELVLLYTVFPDVAFLIVTEQDTCKNLVVLVNCTCNKKQVQVILKDAYYIIFSFLPLKT